MADQFAGWTLQPAQQEYSGWKLQPADEKPGAIRSALTAAATPFKAYEPLIEKQRENTGPSIISKDSPDALAAAGQFVAGMPGVQPGSHEGEDRLGRFAQENPKTSLGLRLAGGMAMPTPTAPAESAAQAAAPSLSAIPNAMGSMANRLAARMLKGDPSQYTKLGAEGVQKLGDFLLRKGAVQFGSSPAAVAGRIPALEESTGAALGEATSALEATGAKVSKEAMATRLDTLAEDAAKQGPGAAAVAQKYRAAAQAVRQEALESGEPMMSFSQAEKWKQGYQAPINYAKRSPTPPEMGSQQIASAARQNVEDAAAVAGEGTPLLDDFLNAKKESGLAQQAGDMIKGEPGREMSRNLLGPAAKAVQFGAAGAALAHGNLPAAGAALLAGPAYKMAQQRLPSAAAVTLKAGASAADKLLSITTSNPAQLGRYGAILSRALQSGGQNAFDANAYALSQTDPQFQEMSRRLSESDKP